MKNIHVLPTDKPSRLYLDRGKLWIDNLVYGSNNQHIYITSDEKFVIDEYITDVIEVIKATPKLVDGQGLLNRRGWKKIILTTDGDLIKDGVQSIDNEFLEWFVKNPSCDFVEVNKMRYGYLSGFAHVGYQLIIPKEEQKQHLIDMMRNDEELGLYDESKQICECIDECLGYLTKECKKIEETKQETTLEEAAEMYAEYQLKGIVDKSSKFECVNDFIAGAKWQEKRMYSEEEVETIAKDAYAMGRNNILIGVFNKWFEQFKKK